MAVAVGLWVAPVQAVDPVRLSGDGRGFVLGDSDRPFRIWGVNYDHDATAASRLLEDYWEEEWETVCRDLEEIRELGANVVRIHLQFGKFMESTNTPNAAALARLSRLIDLAEEKGLYLNLTGLGCYHRRDVPDWYDALDEADRWEAQAVFWRAIARVGRGRAAVFCYDLMNEPVVGGNEAGGWLAGEFGGKHLVQRLTLKQGGRPATEIARAWVAKLTGAIREQDPDTLMTVGVIPWAMTWPNARPVFYSPEVAALLDFVSVHFYPKVGEVDQALEALRVYDIGKPLVIEELFPLRCAQREMEDFIRRSEETAEGWISFYWGRTIEEYEAQADATMADAIMVRWLRYFREAAPRYRQPQ
ncbi:MAG TPA: hypothetical protein DCY13_04480 [Verrucomicrobiales bacterium]|nr:hypothetical protein [Verrucomicrobiales bacterium]